MTKPTLRNLITSALGLALTTLLACAPQEHSGSVALSNNPLSGIIQGTDVAATDSFLNSSVGVVDLKSGEVICSGTLIAADVVLTAAHCTANNFQQLAVLFTNQFPQGPVSLQSENVLPVIAGKTTPYWKAGQSIRGDLAVLQVGGALPANYRPAAIFADEKGLPKGATAVVVGFGFTSPDAKTRPALLQKTELTIKNDHYSSTETMFDQSTGPGACSGDSGGPSFALVNEQWLLFGINSQTAAGCTGKFGYLVVTRVASFQEWITATVQELHGAAEKPN